MKKFFYSLLILGMLASCGDDDSAPELTITTANPVNANPGDDIIISGSATDDIDLVSVVMSSDGLGLDFTINGSDLDANPNFDITVTLDTSTPAGEYKITITANDSANQATTEELDVIVN